MYMCYTGAMNTKTTISISEARKRLFEVAEDVQSPQTIFTFTEKGKPKAVMMSAENFESWAETLEVMSLFPDLKKDYTETKKAITNKTYTKWATLNKVFPAREESVIKKVSRKRETSKK